MVRTTITTEKDTDCICYESSRYDAKPPHGNCLCIRFDLSS